MYINFDLLAKFLLEDYFSMLWMIIDVKFWNPVSLISQVAYFWSNVNERPSPYSGNWLLWHNQVRYETTSWNPDVMHFVYIFRFWHVKLDEIQPLPYTTTKITGITNF